MRVSLRFGIGITLAVCVAMLVPAVASAAVFRTGDTVVIARGETIDDDLYVTAGTIQVLGRVNGDVFATGQSVEIAGPVADDVMAAGQTVRVTGETSGTVRVAGQDVAIESAVGRDVMAAGSNVRISDQSRVSQDAYLAGSTVLIAGPVGRNANASGNTVDVNSSIGADARLEGNSVVVAPAATIGGNLAYSANVARIDGTVSGQTKQLPSPDQVRKQQQEAQKKARSGGGGGFGALVFLGMLYWIRSLIGYVLFGLIVVLVFRRFSAESADALRASYWPALGWGALIVFATPFVLLPAFLFGLLIGGWWIAVLALFAWFTLMAVGLIVGALCLGRLIVSRGEHKPHDVWPMLLGLLIVWVAFFVPLIGGLVAVGTLVFGVGGVVMAVAARRKSRVEPAAEAGAPVGLAPPHADPPVEAPPAAVQGDSGDAL